MEEWWNFGNATAAAATAIFNSASTSWIERSEKKYNKWLYHNFFRAKCNGNRAKKFFWGLSSLCAAWKISFILSSKQNSPFLCVHEKSFFHTRFRLYAAIRREECEMCSGKTIKIYQAPHEERAIKIIFLDTTLFHQHLKAQMGCLMLSAVVDLMVVKFALYRFTKVV